MAARRNNISAVRMNDQITDNSLFHVVFILAVCGLVIYLFLHRELCFVFDICFSTGKIFTLLKIGLGLTLNKSIQWLKNYGPTKKYIKEVKTACLWKKKSSSFEPDFCPVKLDSDPWIVQPTEHYEELSIEEIQKKNN